MPNIAITVLDVELYAEYRQFYLRDPRPVLEAESGNIWTCRALEYHIGQSENEIAVGTASCDFVKVRLALYQSEPETDITLYDHVTEASIESRSGQLILIDCAGGDTITTLDNLRGPYRVRVLCEGLAEAENDNPVDMYTLQIWPAPPLVEPRVLRWYPNWKPSDTIPAHPYGLRVIVGIEACEAMLQMKLRGLRKAEKRQFAYQNLYYDPVDDSYWEASNTMETPSRPLLLEIALEEIIRDFFVSLSFEERMAETTRQHMEFLRSIDTPDRPA